MNTLTFLSSGDLGDLIYSLPTLKALLERDKKDKAILYLYIHDPRTKLTRESAEFITPLLLAQIYITKVIITQVMVKVDYDLNNWRRGDIFHRHIALNIADEFQLEINIKDGWLELPEQVETIANAGLIILARSMRNRSRNFNWKTIITGLFGKFVFVGTLQEYKDMQFNDSVPHLVVNNALELAVLIKNCKVFIGNQSFPYAIAEALKVPRIQETCETAPNCMPQGENSWSSMNMSPDKIRELVMFLTSSKDL